SGCSRQSIFRCVPKMGSTRNGPRFYQADESFTCPQSSAGVRRKKGIRMLSNARSARSKGHLVAMLLEVAACGGAIGFFGCSSSETPATHPGVTPQTSVTHCGNGVVDPGEACDGLMLQGATCASVTNGAFPVGNLACAPDCSLLDQ